MIYLAYFILVFTILQMTVALVNLLFREKPKPGINPTNPLISVLIPARNEEKNIDRLLGDLVGQDYKNIEISVFNDMSEDSTELVVTDFMKIDSRIKLINGEGLPAGWLGKNWACHSLSLAARGDYYLFLDADVRIGGGIITNILHLMQNKGLKLVSIFPKQIINTIGEKISVPNMNYILLTLLPLVFVRKLKFPSMSAANGQFMFFDAETYRSIRPHELMRGDKVEDIETARYLKKNGFKIACLTGDDTIRCRMYEGLSSAVRGFSKNVAAYFGNSLLLAFAFWLITSIGFIPVINNLPGSLTAIYLIAYLFTRVIVSYASEQKPVDNLLYFLPQQFVLGLFVYRAFVSRYINHFEWKGRNI